MNATDQGNWMLPLWPTAADQATSGAINGRNYSNGPTEKQSRPSTVAGPLRLAMAKEVFSCELVDVLPGGPKGGADA